MSHSNAQSFRAGQLAFISPAARPGVAAPVQPPAPLSSTEARTRALVEEFERTSRDFDALLASKGLTRAQLEKFAERTIAQHPDRASIQKKIAASVSSAAPPAAASAPAGKSIPRGLPATRFMRG